MQSNAGVIVGHADADAIVSALIVFSIGVLVTLVYLTIYGIKFRKLPSTGTYGYLLFEASTLGGVGHVVYKMFTLGYVGKLGPEEHIYIGLGSSIIFFILLKKIGGLFVSMFGNEAHNCCNSEPITSDAD